MGKSDGGNLESVEKVPVLVVYVFLHSLKILQINNRKRFCVAYFTFFIYIHPRTFFLSSPVRNKEEGTCFTFMVFAELGKV